jgi:hypothetical protein
MSNNRSYKILIQISILKKFVSDNVKMILCTAYLIIDLKNCQIFA